MTTTDQNTTHEGIAVQPGQIWEDLDKRQDKRRVVVEIVRDGYAYVRQHYGERRTRLKINRMHKHSTGFRLVDPSELRYGISRADEQKET